MWPQSSRGWKLDSRAKEYHSIASQEAVEWHARVMVFGSSPLRVTRPTDNQERKEQTMSVDTKLAEALKVLQPAAHSILSTRVVDFEDDHYTGFQQILDAPMREVLAVYGGKNTFLYSVRTKNSWSPRQSRAVANIMRRGLRDEQQEARHGYKDPTYKCFTCGEDIVGKDALYEHKRVVHGSGAYPPPSPTEVVNVLPDYVPEFNIDLRLFPPARFAVEDKTGTLRFFIVTELKRRTRLAGRYVWTKFRYANEYLEKGDRTVREQAGDTKKMIGKQRIQQPVYFGEEESLIKAISENPTEAMVRYGKEMHRCAYCGRSLTDLLSRQRGIGPDCWEDKHTPYILRQVDARIRAQAAATS